MEDLKIWWQITPYELTIFTTAFPEGGEAINTDMPMMVNLVELFWLQIL